MFNRHRRLSGLEAFSNADTPINKGRAHLQTFRINLSYRESINKGFSMSMDVLYHLSNQDEESLPALAISIPASCILEAFESLKRPLHAGPSRPERLRWRPHVP